MLYVPLYRPKKQTTLVLRYEGDEDDEEESERQLDTNNSSSCTKRIDFQNLRMKMEEICEEENDENNNEKILTPFTENEIVQMHLPATTTTPPRKKKFFNNTSFVDLSQSSQNDLEVEEDNDLKVDSQKIEEEKKKARETVLKELKSKKNKASAGEATGRAIQLKNGNDVVVYKLDKTSTVFDPIHFFTFGVMSNSSPQPSTPTKKRKRYVNSPNTNSAEKKVKLDSPEEPSTPSKQEEQPNFNITDVLLGFHGNPSSVQKKKKKQVYSIHQLEEVEEEEEGLKLTKDCLDAFTIQEMRMLLSQRGLDSTGKKRDLRKRLEALLKK